MWWISWDVGLIFCFFFCFCLFMPTLWKTNKHDRVCHFYAVIALLKREANVKGFLKYEVQFHLDVIVKNYFLIEISIIDLNVKQSFKNLRNGWLAIALWCILVWNRLGNKINISLIAINVFEERIMDWIIYVCTLLCKRLRNLQHLKYTKKKPFQRHVSTWLVSSWSWLKYT